MRSYRKSSHTSYDLKVHLVWSTKYRYKVLTNEIGLRTREIIRQICDQNDVQIIRGVVSKDHIHLYISYPPKYSVSDLVKRFKGRSSKKLQEEFPQLRKRYWSKHFWSIGYGAFSSGYVTDKMIEEYLSKHKNHSNHNNDDFIVE
jgi:putative transposase